MTLHGGTLLGPIVGSLLIGFDFRLVCFGAAAMFGLVTFLQFRYLPAREVEVSGGGQSMLRSWGEPLRNRPFVLFILAILGLFFLYNQVYLGLPLEVERITGSGVGVGLLFTMLAIVGIFGQLPISTMANARLRPPTAIALGLLLMGLAFVPLLLTAASLPFGTAAAVANGLTVFGLEAPPPLLDALTLLVNVGPLALCCLLLVAGQLLASPFISSTIATLSGGRLVGTYFGMYALVQGLGATFGNLVGGAAFDLARASGSPGLPWALMVAVGLACAAGMVGLDRSGLLAARPAGDGLGGTEQTREPGPRAVVASR